MTTRVYLAILALLICGGCATVTGPLTGKTYRVGPVIAKSPATTLSYSLLLSPDEAGYVREARLSEYLKYHPDVPQDRKQLILQGQVQIGMTGEQADISWGPPDSINRSTTALGVSEQWVYGSSYHSAYLYFENGKLTNIQTF